MLTLDGLDSVDADPIQCQHCKARNARIVDSRKREGSVYRRRECRACNFRWTTIEMNAGMFEVFAARIVAQEFSSAADALNQLKKQIEV